MPMSLVDSSIKIAAAVAVMACLGTVAFAQEEGEKSGGGSENTESMEEVVVRSSRRGDPAEIQARNEALLRARIEEDMAQLRLLDEEYEWRKEGAAPPEEDRPRIRWGYDPRREMEVRRDIPPAQWERDRPATIFSVEL